MTKKMAVKYFVILHCYMVLQNYTQKRVILCLFYLQKSNGFNINCSLSDLRLLKMPAESFTALSLLYQQTTLTALQVHQD